MTKEQNSWSEWQTLSVFLPGGLNCLTKVCLLLNLGDNSNHRLIKGSQDAICMRYHIVLIYLLDLTWKWGEQQGSIRIIRIIAALRVHLIKGHKEILPFFILIFILKFFFSLFFYHNRLNIFLNTFYCKVFNQYFIFIDDQHSMKKLCRIHCEPYLSWSKGGY